MTKTENDAPNPARKPAPKKRRVLSRGGFVLVLVVGMLSVLIVLGMSFAEQGRVDLMGAGNSRDLSITDGLGEAAFQIALAIINDDRNVPRQGGPAWTYTGTNQNQLQGVGFTSRWGYNPYVDATVNADGLLLNNSPGGAYTGLGAGPSHNLNHTTSYSNPGPRARNFLDSWQMMIWNDEPMSSLNDRNGPASTGNDALRYGFIFGKGQGTATELPALTVLQRHPTDPSAMMDTWPLQPMARVKTFLVKAGIGFGKVQISITPTDGGFNLNDVFQPKSASYQPTAELPGYHDTSITEYRGSVGMGDERLKWSSPDRRTLEYMLGKRPTWAVQTDWPYNNESGAEDPQNRTNNRPMQPNNNAPAGSLWNDTGVYNFAGLTKPWGRTQYGIEAFIGQGKLDKRDPFLDSTLFYSANRYDKHRYNMEAPRYVIWNPMQGMSLRIDHGRKPTDLVHLRNYYWYPAGRWFNSPFYAGNAPIGQADTVFQGFGFDRLNPNRAGASTNMQDYFIEHEVAGRGPVQVYHGAGVYGHPKARTFQLHYQSAVAGGRFWSDLQANWYFGGAPGYTNHLGTDKAGLNNWAHLGSSYDSLGFGTNWFTPTQHTWLAGFTRGGRLDDDEVTRGLTRYPGNMPPMKPAATYVYPWSRNAEAPQPQQRDELLPANAHFLAGSVRNSIRAHGIQENWGLPLGAITGQNDLNRANGRFYDAVNVNIATFQVVYGLLTPEKIPSMLNRTVVAPHLHWKARLLDAAYHGMENFERYVPSAATNDRWESYLPVGLKEEYYVGAGLGMSGTHTAVTPPTVPIPPAKAPVPPTQYGRNHYGRLENPTLGGHAGSPGVNIFSAYTNGTNSYFALNYIGPTDPRFSIHRAYGMTGALPAQSPAGGPPTVVYNKMDFTTPEPLNYYFDPNPEAYPNIVSLTAGKFSLSGGEPYRNGSGLPADDVFTDCQYDQDLSPNNIATISPNDDSKMVPRPASFLNWPDYFLQRTARIPKEKQINTLHRFHPVGNKSINPGPGIPFSEGKGVVPPGAGADEAYNAMGAGANQLPIRKLHPIWGLPNPNYLLMYPASKVDNHLWADQFRRYFPVRDTAQVVQYPPAGTSQTLTPALQPCPPLNRAKFWDRWQYVPTVTVPGATQPSAFSVKIHPLLPVTKEKDPGGNQLAPHVPGINKDEAWRITRVGRKYQEILADEIMDYQINPWWPNPQVALSEVSVPLDLRSYAMQTRTGVSGLQVDYGNGINYPLWPVYRYSMAAGGSGLDRSVPNYYAAFNRFWVRPSHKYVRERSSHNGRPWGARNNPIENPGLYPPAMQYFGTHVPGLEWRDWLEDFPKNSLDDATGGDWRHLTGLAELMLEDTPKPDQSMDNKEFFGCQLTAAPGRNHPYRCWADFVAMLGHLVYRSPVRVDAGPLTFVTGGGDERICSLKFPSSLSTVGPADNPDFYGVEAYTVCHGVNADPRNQGRFFDGSKIAVNRQPLPTPGNTGDDALVLVDCLRAGVVARPGFWPISGNYGEFWDPTVREPRYFPASPPGCPITGNEWNRRLNELRGCDVNGIRIEQHYISERSANDVLVSLSNGRIGPIDFDGDGLITMTRKQEVLGYDPTVSNLGNNKYWAGYPWHEENGAVGGSGDSGIVRYHDPKIVSSSYYYTGAQDRLYPHGSPATTAATLDYGVQKAATGAVSFPPANRNEIIRNCVTLPIKFRSNTFRVTVTVQMTDAKYKDVYTTRRYSRVYSRVPEQAGNQIPYVHGQYTGQFILHSSRATQGVDPETSLLGISE